MKNVGVCSWSYRMSARGVAAEMERIGVDHLQLAVSPFVDPKAVVPGGAGDSETVAGTGGGEPAAAQRAFVEEQLASGKWTLSATMFNVSSEDYSTLDAIRRTGGIMPDEHWRENKALIAKAVALSAEWKAPLFMLHAGFLDPSDKAAAAKYADRVSWIRDACAEKGLGLILETGQERADHLAEFLSAHEGIYVNLDPANVILYGMGDPVEALKTLAPWVRHLHFKDALYSGTPGEWGAEVPWGEGKVDAPRFLATLRELGFSGWGAVEREAGDDRAGDIARAVASLRAS